MTSWLGVVLAVILLSGALFGALVVFIGSFAFPMGKAPMTHACRHRVGQTTRPPPSTGRICPVA